MCIDNRHILGFIQITGLHIHHPELSESSDWLRIIRNRLVLVRVLSQTHFRLKRKCHLMDLPHIFLFRKWSIFYYLRRFVNMNSYNIYISFAYQKYVSWWTQININDSIVNLNRYFHCLSRKKLELQEWTHFLQIWLLRLIYLLGLKTNHPEVIHLSVSIYTRIFYDSKNPLKRVLCTINPKKRGRNNANKH